VSHPATTRVGSPEDILRRAAAVPERTGFPTVDELAAAVEALRERRPDLVTVERIGTSRLGEPIPMYRLGEGRRSILVVGGVHPNEPIGSWTVLHLIEQLLEDDALRDGLGASWSIIPCVDPDGMRLNEGWFADPADRSTYFREFYRPAPDEQVEWTFPFRYKKAYFDAMLPETQALARAIDDTRPDLYVALHNSEAGGVYYYLSRPAPGLYDLLHEIPKNLGVPLHQGEPEAAHFPVLAPAIFEMGTLESVYDWTESLGLDPFPPGSGGNASSAYAERYGTLSLIAELPYWTDAAADDTAPLEVSYAEVLRSSGALLVEAGTRLQELLERAAPDLSLDTPFLRGARAFAPLVASVGENNLARAELAASARPATVAERHGLGELVHMYRLRFGGMLVRALAAEAGAGTASAALRRTAAEASALFAAWQDDARDADTSYVLPVASLVGVQYGAILAACAHLDDAP
jgi:hypothetical protein